MKKITVNQLTQAALILALCIASQFLKNVSVYITGPIINMLLILATLITGPAPAVAISVITPITSFIITGSPLIKAIPLIMPMIMIGNVILCVFVWAFNEKIKSKAALPIGLAAGSIVKSAFMGLSVSLILIPVFGSNLMSIIPNAEKAAAALSAAKITFSLTQLTTALLGSVLALAVWKPLKKALNK